MLPAANVNEVDVVVLTLPKFAVTDAGRPVAVSATPALRPLPPMTLIVVPTLAPPAESVRAVADDEMLKLGTGIVKLTVVELVLDPAVPVTVTA